MDARPSGVFCDSLTMQQQANLRQRLTPNARRHEWYILKLRFDI